MTMNKSERYENKWKEGWVKNKSHIFFLLLLCLCWTWAKNLCNSPRGHNFKGAWSILSCDRFCVCMTLPCSDCPINCFPNGGINKVPPVQWSFKADSLSLMGTYCSSHMADMNLLKTFLRFLASLVSLHP